MRSRILLLENLITNNIFDEVRRCSIDSLNLEYQEYKHQKTGARHIHLAADDDQNAFLVAFLTVPQDSTGVAHILEHTVLCGSKRYPVRDPFFMMKRRSLNTYMNASTASDWTAYPFASRNRKDFFNLLDVYLDSAFHPNLDELDFRQEGHRLDFSETGNSDSPLEYRGVVFNEMKGANSSPIRRLHNHFTKALYPGITYHHDSGGDPAEIPSLSWEQLKSFHAQHYHPSNAVFLTYGDLPAHELQEKIKKTLSDFDPLDVSSLVIPDEKRYTTPQQFKGSYPLPNGPTENRTHVVLGWLLGKNSNRRKVMEAQVLSGVLMNNSSSPLKYALETSSLGSSPSPLCGVNTSTREMYFATGIEGTDPERADEVEALILGVLNDVAENGVAKEAVMSVLHQFELQQRAITGGRYPYGLQLCMRALAPVFHGGDPVDALEIDELLVQLQRDAEDHDFIPRLVKELLLENPHRIQLTMAPDPQLTKKEEAAEAAKLSQLDGSISDAERQHIAQLSVALEERQLSSDNPELLPKVTLADVPSDLKLPTGTSRSVGSMPVCWYSTGTNGLTYQQLVTQLPEFDEELINVLPYYAMALANVGCAGRDYRQTQAEKALVLGGLSANISTRSVLNQNNQLHAVLTLSSRGLNRNSDHITRFIEKTMCSPNFTEVDRIGELIAQSRARVDSSIAGSGHSLAMSAASSRISVIAALSNQWGGLQAISDLKIMDDKIKKNKDELHQLADQFQAIHDKILNAPQEWLVVSAHEQQEVVEKAIEVSKLMPNDNIIQPFNYQMQPETLKQAWSTNVQVNYCARAHATVPAGHKDSAALTVLAKFLSNGYLHGAIREKGGAYGGGAGYHGESSAFRFYSYRDPRLQETYNDFDASIEWVMKESHDKRLLEEAILGVIGNFDKIGSPAAEATSNYYSVRFGRGADYIRNVRTQILSVTLEDLQRVASRYLRKDNVSYAVVGPADKLQRLDDFDQLSV